MRFVDRSELHGLNLFVGKGLIQKVVRNGTTDVAASIFLNIGRFFAAIAFPVMVGCVLAKRASQSNNDSSKIDRVASPIKLFKGKEITCPMSKKKCLSSEPLKGPNGEFYIGQVYIYEFKCSDKIYMRPCQLVDFVMFEGDQCAVVFDLDITDRTNRLPKLILLNALYSFDSVDNPSPELENEYRHMAHQFFSIKRYFNGDSPVRMPRPVKEGVWKKVQASQRKHRLDYFDIDDKHPTFMGKTPYNLKLERDQTGALYYIADERIK